MNNINYRTPSLYWIIVINLILTMIPLTSFSEKWNVFLGGISLEGIKSYIIGSNTIILFTYLLFSKKVKKRPLKICLKDLRYYIIFSVFCILSVAWSISKYYSLRYIIFLYRLMGKKHYPNLKSKFRSLKNNIPIR